MFVSKYEDSSKTENRSLKEHHIECLRWFLSWRKGIKKCSWLIIPWASVFKTTFVYPFKKFTLWEIEVRKPDFAAVSLTYDMHKLVLLYYWYARVLGRFFYKKRLIPRNVAQRRLSLGWRKSEHASAYHEDPSKTANRSWKERQGKILRHFFKRIMWLGKKLILPSILKLYPLKNS